MTGLSRKEQINRINTAARSDNRGTGRLASGLLSMFIALTLFTGVPDYAFAEEDISDAAEIAEDVAATEIDMPETFALTETIDDPVVPLVIHDESGFRNLKDRTIAKKSLSKLSGASGGTLNLRTLIGEKRTGYAVVQGSCTDGTYAYYLMVSSYNQKGRIAKVSLSNNKLVKLSGVLNICHGNGMTYDSRRNLLIINARESRRQELTCVNANTLKITRQEKVRYTYYKKVKAGDGSISSIHRDAGIAAVAYNAKYDCYIALERTYHNLLFFDPDSFEAIGMAYTTITAKYPGVYQAMDADDQYVYLLLSSKGSSQPYNVILALDWNSESLLPVVNNTEGNKGYISEAWYCNNSSSRKGYPDAAIRVKTPYEAESIYHTTDTSGREHFYLSEYYSDPSYKTVNKKVAYKVKWKKVTKKVKWKKVKGKWKYKNKKVWKYKTKYKTVRKKVIDHLRRQNYVYDIGVI